MKWTDYTIIKVKGSTPETNSRFLIRKCNRDILMNIHGQIVNAEVQNPFKDMGFIKFWIVSIIFWFFFPVSLALCYITLGSVRTKQLVKALIHDFLQTLFIILVLACIIISTIYHYVSGLF
jgi:formate hydrogenlyase subunit 4